MNRRLSSLRLPKVLIFHLTFLSLKSLKPLSIFKDISISHPNQTRVLSLHQISFLESSTVCWWKIVFTTIELSLSLHSRHPNPTSPIVFLPYPPWDSSVIHTESLWIVAFLALGIGPLRLKPALVRVPASSVAWTRLWSQNHRWGNFWAAFCRTTVSCSMLLWLKNWGFCLMIGMRRRLAWCLAPILMKPCFIGLLVGSENPFINSLSSLVFKIRILVTLCFEFSIDVPCVYCLLWDIYIYIYIYILYFLTC